MTGRQASREGVGGEILCESGREVPDAESCAFETTARRRQWNDQHDAARDSQAIKGLKMSRIGKKPIPLAAGVKDTVENGNAV